MMRIRRTRNGAIAALAVLTLGAAACGDDADDASTATDAPAATDAAGTEPMAETTDPMMAETTEPMGTEPMGTEPMGTESMGTESMGSEPMMMEPSGPACASIPAEGEGSFTGMADDPAATAASNNPELSTLVTAVDAAGLVDTLNGEGPFTIFAPANSAFEAIPPADLDALLADPQGALTDILTLHVVPVDALSSTELVEAGMAEAIAGPLTVTAESDTVTVDAGGGPATVVCADVPVANGVVHIIDTVLLPAA